MESAFGTLQSEICRNCGHRHFDRSRSNRICGSYVATQDYLASAKGIIEKASEARFEAEARLRAAATATPGGPRQARHLAEADRNFQIAYELEN